MLASVMDLCTSEELGGDNHEVTEHAVDTCQNTANTKEFNEDDANLEMDSVIEEFLVNTSNVANNREPEVDQQCTANPGAPTESKQCTALPLVPNVMHETELVHHDSITDDEHMFSSTVTLPRKPLEVGELIVSTSEPDGDGNTGTYKDNDEIINNDDLNTGDMAGYDHSEACSNLNDVHPNMHHDHSTRLECATGRRTTGSMQFGPEPNVHIAAWHAAVWNQKSSTLRHGGNMSSIDIFFPW